MTRYATSQYPKSPKGSVIWYGELLYTCNEIISEFECFIYFIDEIVIMKILWMGLNSRSGKKRCRLFWSLSYWWTCLIEKIYTHFLIVASGIFVPDCK